LHLNYAYVIMCIVLLQLDTNLPLCPEDEKLQMRKWVINSVLESEKTYLGILDILMQVSMFILMNIVVNVLANVRF